MADPIEKQVEDLNANITRLNSEIKPLAEQAIKEAKNAGEVNAETRAKVDELLVKYGEAQARMAAVEQAVAAGRAEDGPQTHQTAGQMVSASLTEQGVNSSSRGAYRVAIPQAAITSVTGSGGDLVQSDRQPGIVAAPNRRLTIRDLVAPGTTSSNNIEYVKETGFTNSAAMVSEGGQKPYSEIAFELANAPVRTIAHLFKASRQILDDAPGLASYIDARGTYGLDLKEESQFLYGNGAGVNLNGIIPQAESFVAAFTPEKYQGIDRVRLAILQAILAEYPASGIVLHPADWAQIELTKDANGNYIIARPQDGTPARLWNLPVVATQAIVQDDFLVGAFRLGAQVFDRMDTEILVSTENDKDFEKNMVTIRAERRLAFAVYRPEAFVTGQLSGS
ncbi:phage major capsid protein [Castellaniella hirudinis]|uniref:phage major capsid protein n=1 Tax=Castellaniella hirudinis TaxID=1144617 RepID=UPI0039C23255